MLKLLKQYKVTLIVFMVVSLFLISARNVERIGDHIQIALPLTGLACAVGSGQGLQYFGRYVLLEVGIKGPKYALGDAQINQRPNGSTRGFPSGHTAAATFGAVGLTQTCLRNSPAGQAIVIVAAGFTGASRMDAGQHTIWQVLAGALWGWLAQVMVWRKIVQACAASTAIFEKSFWERRT